MKFYEPVMVLRESDTGAWASREDHEGLQKELALLHQIVREAQMEIDYLRRLTKGMSPIPKLEDIRYCGRWLEHGTKEPCNQRVGEWLRKISGDAE